MGTKATKSVKIAPAVKTRNSLIDYAISQMAESGKPNMVAIAQGVQTVNETDPVLRIGMYARRLNDARKPQAVSYTTTASSQRLACRSSKNYPTK